MNGPPPPQCVVRVHGAWDRAGAGHVPNPSRLHAVPRPGFYPVPTREGYGVAPSREAIPCHVSRESVGQGALAPGAALVVTPGVPSATCRRFGASMPSISTQSPARSPRYVDWSASVIAIAHLRGDDEEHHDRQPERAALEEDAAHVVPERLIDIVEHGERGLEEPIRNGSEEAALETPGIPQRQEDDQRRDHPRRRDVPSAPGSLVPTGGTAAVDVDPASVLVAGAARPVCRARISSAWMFARP